MNTKYATQMARLNKAYHTLNPGDAILAFEIM